MTIPIARVGSAIKTVERYGSSKDRRMLRAALEQSREATVDLAIRVLEREGKTDRAVYRALKAIVRLPRPFCLHRDAGPGAIIVPFPPR
jgi:hypothetical protein